MPSVRQIGGVSGKSRRRYTINEKLVFIRLLGELCHSSTSKANAARALNIPLSTIEKWMKEGTILQLHAAPQKAIKSGHPGPNHQLDAFKDEILNWIFEHREQGVCITVNAVVVHACSLSHEFAIKTWKVKARSVSRFLKKWGYVHRLGTHKSQTDPSLVQDEAREWMAMIVPTLVGPERDPNFILNMDQTPVKFENTSKGTLEKTGTKTITILATDADKRRCTAAITITASGIQLPNMVIFRGTATGRIARTELSTYPAGAVYATQAKAWMDARCMEIWVSEVLAPYVATAPAHITPIIFLDSYRCHMMPTVVSKMEDLGVEVQHIPGGCTSLCQPVDVGFNKPFKSRMTNLWNDFMVNTGLVNGKIVCPERIQVATWIKNASDMLEGHTALRNAWKKKNYEWFVE